MPSPARVAAFHALRAVSAGRADLPATLAHARQRLRDDRDRALAAEIVIGTLRRQRTLDHLIVRFAQRPLHRIDDDVLTILRLSLYQILHLDRVPAAAVVDDAVDLTRGARKPAAAGFVNAVLRAALRQRHRLPLPPRPSTPDDRDAAVAYLGIAHSHPDWLVARWLARHGFDAAERWVRFNNEAPPLTLRVNRLRATRQRAQAILAADGIETTPTRYAPDGLTVTAGNPLRRQPDGLFVVQDEASQLVTLAVGAAAGNRVLDLCASPGGKTTAMAADMTDAGLIVACDVRPRRLALLADTVRLSGARSIRLVRVDPAGGLPFRAAFDRVLVDAPCSGLGTIRRDPDIRWRRREQDLAAFARSQIDLLLRAADAVAPGGRLVYATCSSEPEENDQVVERFLAHRRDFSLLDLRGRCHAALEAVLDSRGMLRTLPPVHGLEAFFAAALGRSIEPAIAG
ncbi:MAG TPA: 16S rRNA (cytosine(967)-C(5))-methyltransferase RsmB [Vicinamibacterales bacterium]|nr:16S rRNA (cytosine(967)-C(5))-methyltransferase RsmB [Vicinamibacterales bacterium]